MADASFRIFYELDVAFRALLLCGGCRQSETAKHGKYYGRILVKDAPHLGLDNIGFNARVGQYFPENFDCITKSTDELFIHWQILQIL